MVFQTLLLLFQGIIVDLRNFCFSSYSPPVPSSSSFIFSLYKLSGAISIRFDCINRFAKTKQKNVRVFILFNSFSAKLFFLPVKE